MPTEDINPDDLLPYIHVLCGDIDRLNLIDAPISGDLLMQMTFMMMTPRLGHDPQSVLKAIHKLENDSDYADRHIQPFTRQDALEGLYKAHYYDAPFVFKNIQNGLFKRDGEAKSTLKAQITGLIEKETPSAADIPAFSHEIITGTYKAQKSRPKGLTGEWIVMDKVDDHYRYLCLATHDLATNHEAELVDMVEDARASMSDTQTIYHWALKRYQSNHWE